MRTRPAWANAALAFGAATVLLRRGVAPPAGAAFAVLVAVNLGAAAVLPPVGAPGA
jgi:hypothetical protein